MARVLLENQGVVVDVTVPVRLEVGALAPLAARLAQLVAELIAHGYTDQASTGSAAPQGRPVDQERGAEPAPAGGPATATGGNGPAPAPLDPENAPTSTGSGSSTPDEEAASGSVPDAGAPEDTPPGRTFRCAGCHEAFSAALSGPLPKRCPACAHQHRIDVQRARRGTAQPAAPAEPPAEAPAPAPATAHPWRCGDCPETFTSKDQLTRHRLAAHAPARPKGEKAVVDLEETRPFACDWCDRSFKYGHELAHHVRVQHTTTEVAPVPTPATTVTTTVRTGEDRQVVVDRLARALAIAEGKAS